MPILFIVGPKCGRVACCLLVSHGEYADGTDRQTEGNQTVTLRFWLDTANVITLLMTVRKRNDKDKELLNQPKKHDIF